MTSKEYHYPHRVLVETANVFEKSFTREIRTMFENAYPAINSETWVELRTLINLSGTHVGLFFEGEPVYVKQNFLTLSDLIYHKAHLFRASMRFGYRSKDKNLVSGVCAKLNLDLLCTRMSRDKIYDALTGYLKNVPDYEEKLWEHGVNPLLVDDFSVLAEKFIEMFRLRNIDGGAVRFLRHEQQNTLNTLNREMEWYCEKGKTLFKNDKEKLKLFSFSVIAKQFSSKRKEKSDVPVRYVPGPDINCPHPPVASYHYDPTRFSR